MAGTTPESTDAAAGGVTHALYILRLPRWRGSLRGRDGRALSTPLAPIQTTAQTTVFGENGPSVSPGRPILNAAAQAAPHDRDNSRVRGLWVHERWHMAKPPGR
jgi:hypothetical protein